MPGCAPFAETVTTLPSDFTNETFEVGLHGNTVEFPLGCDAAQDAAVFVLEPADADRDIEASTCGLQASCNIPPFDSVINVFSLMGAFILSNTVLRAKGICLHLQMIHLIR